MNTSTTYLNSINYLCLLKLVALIIIVCVGLQWIRIKTLKAYTSLIIISLTILIGAIISIYGIEQIRTIAQIFGGIGSLIAIAITISLWKQAKKEKVIQTTVELFGKWFSLCKSCADIDSYKNYISNNSVEFDIPDAKAFDELIYLYDSNIDKNYKQHAEIEQHYWLIRSNFENAIQAGFIEVDSWANGIVQRYQLSKQTPPIGVIPSEAKILEDQGLIVNNFHLRMFKDQKLHILRCVQFIGGFQQYLSKNNINFVTYAEKIIELKQAYKNYLVNLNIFKIKH